MPSNPNPSSLPFICEFRLAQAAIVPSSNAFRKCYEAILIAFIVFVLCYCQIKIFCTGTNELASSTGNEFGMVGNVDQYYVDDLCHFQD
jgi:hypothetical protein